MVLELGAPPPLACPPKNHKWETVKTNHYLWALGGGTTKMNVNFGNKLPPSAPTAVDKSGVVMMKRLSEIEMPPTDATPPPETPSLSPGNDTTTDDAEDHILRLSTAPHGNQANKSKFRGEKRGVWCCWPFSLCCPCPKPVCLSKLCCWPFSLCWPFSSCCWPFSLCCRSDKLPDTERERTTSASKHVNWGPPEETEDSHKFSGVNPISFRENKLKPEFEMARCLSQKIHQDSFQLPPPPSKKNDPGTVPPSRPQKKPSFGGSRVEKRVDESIGQAYTQAEFMAYYGGLDEWNASQVELGTIRDSL